MMSGFVRLALNWHRFMDSLLNERRVRQNILSDLLFPTKDIVEFSIDELYQWIPSITPGDPETRVLNSKQYRNLVTLYT
jgi:hypothetical protein